MGSSLTATRSPRPVCTNPFAKKNARTMSQMTSFVIALINREGDSFVGQSKGRDRSMIDQRDRTSTAARDKVLKDRRSPRERDRMGTD
tara:strand:+ start:26 stop:289 length:264 start_codon:yes stop_codon:yes gene_type:complete